MSDHTGFMADIIANPDDDAVRLIYADWLDDHGQGESAEFICVQCGIAELEKDCLCVWCVKRRGGGQHHNGPCAVDQERVELPDGRSRQAFLRRREWELEYTPRDGRRMAEELERRVIDGILD